MTPWRIASQPKPVVVRPPVELDALTAPPFRDDLALLLAQGLTEIVVDMREVTFVDSSGMGALVAGQKLAIEKGGGLELHHVRPSVARALQMAGLIRVLAVEEDEG